MGFTFWSKIVLFLAVFQSKLSQIKEYTKGPDCFEQLANYANDSHHYKRNLFFDQFSNFL